MSDITVITSPPKQVTKPGRIRKAPISLPQKSTPPRK